ncbi:MAG: N-acetylmuramoyl-L-alanine amidase [Fibrella sp.]|nr:N-acetylmuramoyl-L-alanine amidase [Armatimonadota bacterium]
MFRSSPCCVMVFLLLFGSSVSPVNAVEPPVPAVTPPMPVVETPDFLGAVWEPAAPTNFKMSARPSVEQIIDRIVIHDIEGPAMSAVRWFQNPKAQVSSHYVVDAQTGTVYQQVKERDVAWHAGDRLTNARSVGIEHGGYAYRPGFFSVVQYEASAKLVRDISRRHNIPRDREHIIGHFEVPDSANPGKFGGRGGHTDPGPYWDWDYFMTLVRSDAKLPPYLSGTAPRPASSIFFMNSNLSYASFILHPGETKTATFLTPGVMRSSLEGTFAFANVGDDPWLADRKDKQETERRKLGTVFLGTASGQDSRLAAADWVSPRYVGSSVDGDIAPGSSGKFAMSLRAPTDFLGEITETFRLVNVPPAPRQPVPFGQTVTLTVRVEPWDIVVPLPSTAPPGWNAKTMPDGSRLFWRKAGKQTAPIFAKNPNPGSIRWETNLPIAGRWDIYVRYPEATSRSPRATYGIWDALFQSKEVDQRKGNGAWIKLGRYRFDVTTQPATVGATFSALPPGTRLVPAVIGLEANASEPGVLIAGAVRFVGPFPDAPDLSK